MDTKKLRQKILDLAIHGKLVPQDPNDEPASVLLERIRAEKERLISEGKIKRSRKSAKTTDTHHYEQDVLFEVPAGWKLIALEEIFILNPKNEVDDETLAGFIPMALVDDGFCGSHSFEQELWKNIKKGFSHFQNGDIGIAKISPCFENMKSVIFNNLPNGLGAGTTELTILRGILIDVKFYLYLFKTSWYINQGTKYFKGVVGQQRVNKAIFTTLEVPLPPLAEQRRIVAEIERWFTLVDTIERGKENLETSIKQAKSKILDLAIHGKLVPQDPNDEPASELLKRINPKAQITCDNGHYAQLPKGWSICELMDVAKIVTGSTPSKSNLSYYGGNFPLYRPSDLDAGRHTNTASEYLTTKGRDVSRIIPPNSIAICCIGSIGKVGYIEQEGTTNQQINTAIPSLAIFPDYLYHLCTSTYFQNSLMEKSSAVTISIVNKSKMEHIKIPLPPKEEQARIVVAIDNLFNALDAVKENL